MSYTGTGSNPATVGHGLGVTPKMIIVKPRSIAYSWCVYHVDAGAGNLLYYDTNGGAGGSGIVVVKELNKASGVWSMQSQDPQGMS